MNYKILENFIDEKSCVELISDAKKYSTNDQLKVQNERSILPSSSQGFYNLIQKSKAWNKLHQYLNSQDFLKLLQDQLKIQNQKYLVTNFFF